MEGSSPLPFLVVVAAAAVAPMLAELTKRWRIPSVLYELTLGILVGPHVLGWAQTDEFISTLSSIGLAFLMFMAGYEIDFQRVRGAPLNRAVGTWLVSLALGLGIGAALAATGFVLSNLLIGLALTTTAIGTLLPMIRDRGLLTTRWGTFAFAGGTVGEFGPIVAVTILLGSESPAHELVLMIAFVVVAVGAAYLAARPQPPGLVAMLQRNLNTSTQLPVRIVVLLLVVMLYLAFSLGLDTLLGAFAAGILARLALHRDQAEGLERKLEAIGFGFLIPVFFVVSGMGFDVTALGDPSTLARVPLFLALFLVVRGLPVLFTYRKVLGGTERWALGIVQATALPLVVVITQIGIETQRMKPENAAALVGAGMLSVLVFPLVGFGVLDRARAEPASQEPGEVVDLQAIDAAPRLIEDEAPFDEE